MMKNPSNRHPKKNLGLQETEGTETIARDQNHVVKEAQAEKIQIGDSIAKEKILQILMRPLQRPLEVALETVRGQGPGQRTLTVIQGGEVIQETVNVKTVQILGTNAGEKEIVQIQGNANERNVSGNENGNANGNGKKNGNGIGNGNAKGNDESVKGEKKNDRKGNGETGNARKENGGIGKDRKGNVKKRP